MAMATPEEQLGQILAILSENSKGINELKSSMTEMRALKTDLLLWKPEVDQRVHELEHVVLDLGECIDHALGSLVPQAQPLERSDEEPSGGVTIAQPPLTAAIREDHFDSSSVKMPSSAHLELHPPRAASGSLDHDKGSTHRGADFGAVYTIAREPAPVTGFRRQGFRSSTFHPASVVTSQSSLPPTHPLFFSPSAAAGKDLPVDTSCSAKVPAAAALLPPSRADVSSVKAPDRNRRGSVLYAAAQDLQTAGKRRTLKASRRSMTRPHNSDGRSAHGTAALSIGVDDGIVERDGACNHVLRGSVRGS